MKHIHKNPLTIVVGIAVASLVSQSVTAQEDAAPQPIEEVIVTASPIRDSQAAAIDAKRSADNVVDVISADTIGQFPDQNLADALVRIPGVAVERDQGQARYINFRGAPFKYTSLALDGIVLPGAENGRVPRFDSFPAVITSRIEANKAITADMPGEALAGFINVATHDPFSKEGFGFTADVGRGEQDLGGGDLERNRVRLSWSDDNFGFLAFYSDDSREQVTDSREYDMELDANGDRVVHELDFRNYKVKRDNEAYGGRVEYRFDDNAGRIFLSSTYTEFTDTEERNQFVFDFAAGGSSPVGDSEYVPLVEAARWLSNGQYENSTTANTLGLDWEQGNWFIETRLNFTETENVTDVPLPLSLAGLHAASYDISNLEDPVVELFEQSSMNPITIGDVSYGFNILLDALGELDIENTLFKLDASRDLQLFGLDSSVKLGTQLEQRESDGFNLGFVFLGIPAALDPDLYNTGRPWDTGFTNSIGGTYYDNEGYFNALGAAGLLDDHTVSPDRLIGIDEDIYAVYGMITHDFSWGNLIYGLRLEQTDYTSQGEGLEFSDDFLSVLPSVHLNYNLSENQKLRAAFTTAVSRPTYEDWRFGANVVPGRDQVEGGNPTLEEENSYGLDLSYEFYIGAASMFSAAVYHRELDNVIYGDVTLIDPGIYFPPAAGETWEFIGPVNGEGGHLTGLELGLILQGEDVVEDFFLPGLGINVNATFIDSEFETNAGTRFSLPGTSDVNYNASIFYENYGISTRLSYSYRDEWFTTVDDVSGGDFWAEQERLDFSIRYTLPWDVSDEEITVYLDMNNLTDENDVRYTDTPRTPNQVEGYGRRYLLGIQINY